MSILTISNIDISPPGLTLPLTTAISTTQLLDSQVHSKLSGRDDIRDWHLTDCWSQLNYAIMVSPWYKRAGVSNSQYPTSSRSWYSVKRSNIYLLWWTLLSGRPWHRLPAQAGILAIQLLRLHHWLSLSALQVSFVKLDHHQDPCWDSDIGLLSLKVA